MNEPILTTEQKKKTLQNKMLVINAQISQNKATAENREIQFMGQLAKFQAELLELNNA